MLYNFKDDKAEFFSRDLRLANENKQNDKYTILQCKYTFL